MRSPASTRGPGRLVAAAAVAALSCAPLAAQDQDPCGGEEHRQFDFWIGDWEVTNLANGNLAGTNEITAILGGCVLLERYETPGGYAGRSYNAYDRQTGRWHQTWVDNAGLVLRIEGGIEDGRMVLAGPGKDRQGRDILNRITWTPHDDGTVQQTWTVSRDGGETWSSVFDGRYRKR